MSRLLRVDFFYDIVSPYSLIGMEILHRYERLWNLQINLCPIFLGGVMVGSKNTPPGQNAAKGAYMFKDLRRTALQANIPISPPSDFFAVSVTSLNAMRLLTAIKAKAPSFQRSVALAFWRRVWLRDLPIKDADCLHAAMIDGGISDASQRAALLEFAASAEVKDRLRALTDRLVVAGAYGAPVLLYHTGKETDTSSVWKDEEGKEGEVVEFFFGSDRFDQAAAMLGKKYLGPNPEGGHVSAAKL